MDARDVLPFLERDWARVAAAKAEHWARRKERLGPIEGLRASDALRRQVLAGRPGWPSAADRAADFAAHVELSRRMRHAGASFGR